MSDRVSELKLQDTSGVTIDPATEATAQAILAAIGGSVATTILDGTRTVAAAGTPVPLTAGSTAARKVMVQADLNNTGNILVGNATSQSNVLLPGDNLEIEVDDLDELYIDSTVNGEGVNYLAVVTA